MAAEWIFDPAPPSGSRKGGLANAQVFDPSIDTFVREVLQNSKDQTLGEGDAVSVRFSLTELTGPAVTDFLAAISWDGLGEHITAASEAGGITIAGRLRDGPSELEEGTLRVLQIEDRYTRGLTGGEDEDESNFNALCRHELVTSSERKESGGSFGIGKSVLWRFSNLSTVLFLSKLCDEQRDRFFGRVLLPWHAVGGAGYKDGLAR